MESGHDLAEKIQQKTIKTLASAQVLNGIGVAGTVAAGSLLVSSITNSETLAGLAQTFSVMGAAALAIPLTKFTNYGGRRLALSIGYFAGFLGSIFAILGGVYRNIYLMLIGTFLVGAASAAGYQARFAAIDLVSNETKARQLSFVVWASTIGAVLGPNLMNPSSKLSLNLGLPALVGPYLISGITLLIATIVIFLFLRPDPYLTLQNQNKLMKINQKTIKETFSHIVVNPKALFAILSIAIGHVAMVSVMVMTPVHMAHVDVKLIVIGFVISVHILGMYAFSPLVGTISDKYGKINAIRLGIFILILSMLIAGFANASDSFVLGIGLFLLGLGWSFTLIAGSTFLNDSISIEFKTSSQGTSDLIMNLAGALGGALAGVIIGFLSYGWLCLFASIPVVLLGIYSFKDNINL